MHPGHGNGSIPAREALRPCVALRPNGEFWLRDGLFEEGIVEYVDRGSRSSVAIILLTLLA